MVDDEQIAWKPSLGHVYHSEQKGAYVITDVVQLNVIFWLGNYVPNEYNVRRYVFVKEMNENLQVWNYNRYTFKLKKSSDSYFMY